MTKIGSVMLLMVCMLGNLSTHYLMKNASTDYLFTDLPCRKVIPMVIGSPSKTIKLAPSLWDIDFGNKVPPLLRFSPPCVFERPLPAPPYRFREDLSGDDLSASRLVTGLYRHSLPVNFTLDVRLINDGNVSRGFCQKLVTVALPFLRLAPRSVYINTRVRFVQTLLFRPLDSSFFEDCVTIFNLNVGTVSVDSLRSCFITWYDALYIFYFKRIFRVFATVVRFMVHRLCCFLAFAPILCCVTPVFIFFSAFGWLFCFTIQLLPSLRNSIFFLAFVGSLHSLFSGYSVAPLSVTLVCLLSLDFFAYLRVPKPGEVFVLLKQREVVRIMYGIRGLTKFQRISQAYALLKCYGYCDLGVKRNRLGIEEYFLRDFDIKPMDQSKAQSKMESRILATLWPVQTTASSPLNLLQPFITACGGVMEPRHTLMIQEGLLFVGKIIYMATDKRDVKYAAMAAEIASFRNTSCGMAMSESGFKFFQDNANELFDPKLWDFEVPKLPSTQKDAKLAHAHDKWGFYLTSFSFSDISELLSGVERGLRAQALKRILQIIVIIIALISFCGQDNFSLDGMTRVTKAIKAQPFDDTVDLATQLVSMLKWLADTGWHMFTFSGDVRSAVDAPGQWKKSAEEVLAVRSHAGYINALGTGIIDKDGDRIPLSVFRSRILQLIKTDWKLTESALRVSGSKFLMVEFKALHQKLVAFESELQVQVMNQAYRKAPFGLALVGGTSVGKSTITSLVFAYYSARRNVLHLPEMIFTHPCYTEFWDTFCGQDYILFDDVGALHPQAKTPDNSLFDVLQVMNNAPYIPPLAQADQKGTQCVTAKMVIATSNREDLGARNTFATPEAVLRRFSLIVRMKVKDKFACNQRRLDPQKIRKFWADLAVERTKPDFVRPRFSERFPPFWDFEVLEVTNDGVTGHILRSFNDPESATIDFLEFVMSTVGQHDQNQNRVMSTFESLKEIAMCRCCGLPEDVCPHDRALDCLCCGLPLGMCHNRAEPFILTAGDDDEEVVVEAASYAFWWLISGLIGIPCFSFCFYYLYSSFFGFVYNLVAYTSILICSVQLLSGLFIDRAHSEPLLSSAKMPFVLISGWIKKTYELFVEIWLFLSIVIKGSGSREAFRDGCFAVMKRRVKTFFTTKNMMVLTLVVCISTLIVGPLYGVFFSRKWYTTAGDGEPIPTVSRIIPTLVEDSRSVYYNPNPPQRTMTERSKCLSGSSSAAWIENGLRRSICDISFFDSDGKSLGTTLGTAIGGNLIMTVSHAAVEATSPQLASNKLVATHGVVKFRSLGGIGSISHKFQLTKGSFVCDVSNDFLLFDVASLPSRSSLVDYFLETNDVLDYGFKCRFLEPDKWEFVSDLIKVVDAVFGGFSPGFLVTNFEVTSPSLRGRGHSGALLVAETPQGTVLLGMQSLASLKSSNVISPFIGRSYLKNQIRCLTSQSGNEFSAIPKGPIAGADGVPVASSVFSSQSNPLLHGFEECNHANMSFEGRILSSSGTGKSRFAHPPYREFFLTRGYVAKKEAPIFDWKSKRHYLEQVGKISDNIDRNAVNQVRDALSAFWIEKYSELDELKLLVPLSLEEAINGHDKVAWVEKLKYNTSAGYPWNKPKRELLEVRPNEAYECKYEYYLPPKLLSEFRNYFSSLLDGEPINFPYKGSQKDEGISPEKNATRGPRIFCAANLFVILAGRVLFGSYIRLAQRNFFISWAAVGINASSKVWGLVWNWISYFGTHRIMAGDYSNFDQNMSPLFTRAAYSIIISLLIASGNFSEELICAARSWASEAINPTVLLDSDIFTIAGTNPSGNPLTVHVNCIVNILFIMYVWVVIGNRVEDFFVSVRMMTYGDDNFISVAVGVSNFNYWVIHVQLKKIGVLYTPADKSTPEHKEFDALEDLTFLKRSFEIRDGYCYAPLDMDSFSKTFTSWMESSEDDQTHGLASLCSCWENAVHASPEICQKIHQDILDACAALGWPTTCFKSVTEIDTRFRNAEVNRWAELVEQSGIRMALATCVDHVYNYWGWQIIFWPLFEEIIKSLVIWYAYGIMCALAFANAPANIHWSPQSLNFYLTSSSQLLLMLIPATLFAFYELSGKIELYGFHFVMLPAFFFHVVLSVSGLSFVGRVLVHCLFNITVFGHLVVFMTVCADFPLSPIPVKLASLQSLYNEDWDQLFARANSAFMFHGLAFSVSTTAQALVRWFSIQDSAWFNNLRQIQGPAGPGVVPLLDNAFRFDLDESEEEDEMLGSFDGFFRVDGPLDSELNSEVPRGPVS